MLSREGDSKKQTDGVDISLCWDQIEGLLFNI